MPFFDTIRAGASGAAADYEIERSLRFNDNDTAYLSRNFQSGGNRKKWTFSAWIKRSNLGGSAGEMRIFGGSTNASHIFFTSNDALTWDVAAPGSSASANLTTSQYFRDPSAWYHLVCAFDTDNSTADNRMRIYINGTEVTSFGTRTNPSSGYALNAINADAFADGDRSLHTIGFRTSVQGTAGMEFDGYMAEINFIDGQQYDPSYFGETDATTGQWNPKKYVGSYGTTGFYLNFSDNSGTTATTLGKDSSGNGNNFTPNNFSVSAGAGNDSLEDTPTNNFCTLSPLLTDTRSDANFSNGNLTVTTGSGASTIGTTFPQTSGKWYAEFVCTAKTSVNMMISVVSVEGFDGERQGNESQNGGVGFSYVNNGNRGDGSSYGASWDIDDVMGIALDLDNNTVNFYKNNSAQGTISITDGYNYVMALGGGQSGTTQTFDVNFGQRAFTYTPPTGFKKLNSQNLPDPTINLPNKHFDTLLYTGNSTDNRAITGLNFQPDFTWIKRRSGGGMSHFVVDALRSNSDGGGGNGNDGPLATNSTASESAQSDGGFESFNSDGFTLGKGSATHNADAPFQRNNASGGTYCAWNWNGGGSTVTNNDGSVASQVRASTTAGFSIVTFSGSGNRTIGHGLGVAPQVIIMKGRNVTDQWTVGHQELDASNPWHKGIPLNTNATTQDNAGFWNDTAPTSTVFSKGTWDEGYNMVAYCFSEVAGYSKFGSYTGNGNSDGTFVFTGFRPAWVLIKATTTSENWRLFDSKRSTFNRVNRHLFPSTDGGESEETGLDFLANGFKFRDSDAHQNGSGHTYVYLCFAESPFKYARAR